MDSTRQNRPSLSAYASTTTLFALAGVGIATMICPNWMELLL